MVRLTDHLEELFTLRSQRAESFQKIAHLDVERSELKMASDSAKVEAISASSGTS